MTMNFDVNDVLAVAVVLAATGLIRRAWQEFTARYALSWRRRRVTRRWYGTGGLVWPTRSGETSYHLHLQVYRVLDWEENLNGPAWVWVSPAAEVPGATWQWVPLPAVQPHELPVLRFGRGIWPVYRTYKSSAMTAPDSRETRELPRVP